MKNNILRTNLITRKPSALVLVIAGCAAGIIASHTSSANAVFDLRAVSINGNPNPNPKSAQLDVGSVVAFEMWAVVTGDAGAAALEGFQSAIGNTILTAGVVGGNMSAPILPSDFLGTGAHVGAVADLNGDGFLDIGANSANPNTNVGYWFPRSTATVNTGGVAIPDGQEFKLFSFTFTATQMNQAAGTNSFIQFQQKITGAINSAIWQQDATVYSNKGPGAPTLPLSTFTTSVGENVMLTAVPEPGVAVTLLGGVATLLGLRRRKH